MENTTIKKVTYEINSSSKKILIIFGIILGVLVLVAIILTIFLIKKCCFQKPIKEQITANELITSHMSNMLLMSKNKEEIDKLFKTELIPTKYFKSNQADDFNKCTICQEDYKNGSSIITTKCKHIFHFECFKNWVYNNITIPKCPNCNKPILESDNNTINNNITAISLNTQTI